MSFRYSGLGVGHRSTWEATRVFREEIWQAFKLPLALLDPDSTSNLNNNEDDSTGNSDMSDMQSDADPDDLLQEDVLAVMTADEGDSSDDETGSESDSSGTWEDADVVGEDTSDEDEDLGLESDLEDELDGECDDDDNELGVIDDLGFAAL